MWKTGNSVKKSKLRNKKTVLAHMGGKTVL